MKFRPTLMNFGKNLFEAKELNDHCTALILVMSGVANSSKLMDRINASSLQIFLF